MLRWFFVLLICSIIAAQQQQNSNYVTVNCSQGPVQGRQVDLGNDNSQLYSGQANVYTGIPYCQPPVDNLRFQPPQPLTTFNTSLLNATYFRPKCPQLNAGAPTNEDCLYLNIYTPQSATSSSTNLSVLVFIDGSNGFTNGGCDQSQEKGIISNLVQRQIVVVTLQYRIGALGFFTTYTNTVQSNLGMLDQVQAMTWIKSEIVNFGGNPNQITVAGQDDGACAVSAHTLSPMSQNLFNQAIVQSGSIYSCYNPTPAVPTNPTVYTTTPRPMYDQPNTGYGNAGYQGSYDYQPQSSTTASPYNSANANVQYDDPNQQLAATLCNISSADWNDGQTQNVQNCLKNYTVDFFVNQQPGGPTSTWMIVRDTSFLPGSIDSLSGKRPNIPIIIGTVQDEDADYAFKLINTGQGNDPNNLNNWIFDFAKKNKLNQTQTNQVSNIISNNYGVSTGASVNQNQNQQSNSGQVNNNNNNNQYQYPQANNGYQYTTQPSQQTNNQYQGQQTNQQYSGGVQTSYQNSGQYQQVSYNGQQYTNQNQQYNQAVTPQTSQTSVQNQNQNVNPQQANNQYQNVAQYNGQQYQNQNQYNQPSQASVQNQNQNQNINTQQANNQYQNNGYNYNTSTSSSQYNGGYLRDQPISMQNSNGITDFSQLRKISQISSDQSTSLTTTQIQSYMLNGDRHVRIYQFTHVSEVGRNTVPDTGANWKPVFKGQDMYFITMSETIWSNSSYTAQDRQVADQMGQRWSDFVKTGQVANWDTTSQQNYNYCNLNTQATQQAQYGQQARQVFQDQVNPICQVAQNNYAMANNQSVPYPSAIANTNQIQRTPGTAQAQYTSGANGGSNFHITFQVNGVPFNG